MKGFARYRGRPPSEVDLHGAVGNKRKVVDIPNTGA
jgi:hypothetical protein